LAAGIALGAPVASPLEAQGIGTYPTTLKGRHMKRHLYAAAFVLLAMAGPAMAHGDQFLGEVRALPYDFCPEEWAPAMGQILPIANYHMLFALLGTRYGGDGKTTFALPDLRGAALVSKDGDGANRLPVAQVHWCIAMKGNWPPRH
jgi:hypothetical protein